MLNCKQARLKSSQTPGATSLADCVLLLLDGDQIHTGNGGHNDSVSAARIKILSSATGICSHEDVLQSISAQDLPGAAHRGGIVLALSLMSSQTLLDLDEVS